MKVAIVLRKIDADSSILEYIERRFTFAFGRTRHAIQNATVTLSDVNGPKGGVDKQCRILIKPEGLPNVVVTEEQQNLQTAIDRCMSRASQNLTRKLKRKQFALRGKNFRIKQTPLTLDGQLISNADAY